MKKIRQAKPIWPKKWLTREKPFERVKLISSVHEIIRLLEIYLLTICGNIAAKKKNASIKAKTQRECAGSQITEVTAYVLAARAHKLKERYMNAVNGMIAIDALLNQQSKVVADAAAQFVSTYLLTFLFHCCCCSNRECILE